MLYSVDEQTIIARCTPAGKGAIALLRLSGKHCLAVADKLAKLPGKKLLSEHETHTIQYGWVVDAAGKHIDQVLFLLMKAPKTFTGQDTVEITCHNNPLIIEQIIQRALALGARPAREGEFSKRAVLNDKIDLLQAEAIHDVIVAQNKTAVSRSMRQLEGSLSSWVERLQQKVIELVAFTEASFEFLDEELTFDEYILERLTAMLDALQSLLADFDAQQHIRHGLRIALLGSVNAGKSSLFNVLAKKERAIVTDIAGTTRDTIECSITYNDAIVTLVDTAGLRKTDDVVEKQGIKRSFQEAVQADIVILVRDGARTLIDSEVEVYNELREKYADKSIYVCNKIDQISKSVPESGRHEIFISTKTGEGMEAFHSALQKLIAKKIGNTATPYLITERQHEILQSCLQQLRYLYDKAQRGIEYELLAADLKIILEQLGDLTGRQASEACLDAVFKSFCVGK